jgi:two-component system chemotaxis sensor kinase CheA
VLLLEETAFHRDLLQPVLHAAGYDVYGVTVAEEALDRLRDRRIDVVVADLEREARDGFRLLEALRADPRLADLPVIALSSTVDPEAIERAHRFGILGFVAKFDRTGLLAALAETARVIGEAA